MKPKTSSPKKQAFPFYKKLIEQLNPNDFLLLIAELIPWERFEQDFALLYNAGDINLQSLYD